MQVGFQYSPHSILRLMIGLYYENEMKDVYSTCVDKARLDESPMAYKDYKEIISNIGDTVEIISHIKPLYNFKG